MLPRAYILAILASAKFGASQASLPLPACANECLSAFSSGGVVAGCSTLDIACICANKDFLSASTCCLHANCSDADRETTEAYSRSVCKAAGVAIPSGVGCSTIVSSSAGSSPTGSSKGKTSSNNSSPTTSSSSENQGSGSGSSGSSGSQNSPATPKKKSKSGLAIGLGVGIPVLALLVGVVFLYLRRNKKKQAIANPPPPMVQQPYMPPQGPVNHVYPNGYAPVQELPTEAPVVYEKDGVVMTGSSPANPAELTSEYRPSHNELAGSTPQPRHELPHNPYGHTNQGQ